MGCFGSSIDANETLGEKYPPLMKDGRRQCHSWLLMRDEQTVFNKLHGLAFMGLPLTALQSGPHAESGLALKTN